MAPLDANWLTGQVRPLNWSSVSLDSYEWIVCHDMKMALFEEEEADVQFNYRFIQIQVVLNSASKNV